MTSLATRVSPRRVSARFLPITAAPAADRDAEPVLGDVVPVATASVIYRQYQEDAYLTLRVLVPAALAETVTAVRLGLGVPRGFDPLVVFGEAGRDRCSWTPLVAGAWPQTSTGPLVALDLQVDGTAGPLPFRLSYPAGDGEATIAESPDGERVRVRALARFSGSWC